MIKPTALAIGGFDSGGGAGVESDIKTFETLGVHGVSAITAITSQNTKGIRDVLPIDPDHLKSQIDALLDDFQVKSAKIGMIISSKQMEIVGDSLSGIPFVVDPVIFAKDGTKLIGDVDSLKKVLLRKALVVTPNAIEASILSGVKVSTLEDQIRASKLIHELYSVPFVIVKGGHIESNESIDVMFDGHEIMQLRSPRLDTKNTHGTGSVFASSISALIAKGVDVKSGFKIAKQVVEDSIRFGLEIGKGIGPVDPIARLERKAMKIDVIRDMERFAEFAEGEKNFHLLIPEVQSNLAHSIDPRYVAGLEDIATFKGRIIREWGGKTRVGMPPTFGYPTHTARLLLSIILKEKKATTLMNIRYDEKILNALKAIGYEIVEVDREKEPKGPEGRTMSWIIDFVYEHLGRIPNVIFDKGMVGKEAMIRLWTNSIDEMIDSLRLVIKGVSP